MKNVAERLNPYVANLSVNYAKLHNLHWNVEGKMFVSVHEYVEGIYDSMTEKMDEVAEKIIMLGEKPAVKLNEYLEMATIKETDKISFKDTEVLEIVLEDLKLLQAQVLELRNSFDEDGLFSIVMMLEDHYTYYEKEIWFIGSMLK